MGKLTATVVLFCLFSAALAPTPPGNHESAAAAVALPSSDEVKDENSAVTPLIEDIFRPVNRGSHVRRSKHVRRHHSVDLTERGKVEIPNGDDLAVPSGENNDFNSVSEMIHDGGRQPATLLRHHHLKDDDTESDSSDSESESSDSESESSESESDSSESESDSSESESDSSDSESDDDGEDRMSKKTVRKRSDHHKHRVVRKDVKKSTKRRRNSRFQKEKEEKFHFMNRVRRFLDRYF